MVAAPRAGGVGIYLVQPKFPPSYWGMEHFIALTPYAAVFPPLGLLTLAALTPPEFPVALCDENAGEEVDFATDADIVCITGYIIQIKRVFEIADESGRVAVAHLTWGRHPETPPWPLSVVYASREAWLACWSPCCGRPRLRSNR